MTWAMDQDTGKASHKLLLLAMADCVNADSPSMVCWPSARHLAARSLLDIKTVEAGMKKLRESGFIVDTGERKGTTGQIVVYLLKTPESGHVAPPAPAPAPAPAPVAVAPASTPEIGGVDLLGDKTTGTGGVGETDGKTPGFSVKTPEIPGKDPRNSHATPPKTGDGSSNGTSNGTRKEKSKAVHIDGVPDNLTADWMVVRKEKRAGPLTETALKGLLREAAKAGITVAEAVAFCCEVGWQGFNAGWYAQRQGQGRTGGAARPSKHTGLFDLDHTEGVLEDGSLA